MFGSRTGGNLDRGCSTAREIFRVRKLVHAPGYPGRIPPIGQRAQRRHLHIRCSRYGHFASVLWKYFHQFGCSATASPKQSHSCSIAWRTCTDCHCSPQRVHSSHVPYCTTTHFNCELTWEWRTRDSHRDVGRYAGSRIGPFGADQVHGMIIYRHAPCCIASQ